MSAYGRVVEGAHPAADGTQPGSTRPVLICIPSSDTVFRELAHDLAGALGRVTPSDLENALRTLYPQVLVRPRELEGEAVAVWYVYRDGSYPSK